MEGHAKYYCKFLDYFDQDVRIIQTKVDYDIFQASSSHSTKDCYYNLQKSNPKLCAICEDNVHFAQECPFYGKIKPNYHIFYHTQATDEIP